MVGGGGGGGIMKRYIIISVGWGINREGALFNQIYAEGLFSEFNDAAK